MVRSLHCLLLAFLTVASARGQEAHRPIANVGPVEIDFGEINIARRAVVPVTLRNLTASTMSLAGGGVSSSDGFGSAAGSCTSMIAPGASCVLNYFFQPKSRDGVLLEAGTTLVLTAGGQSRIVPVQLRGRGVGTLIDFSPTRFDFGEVLLGQSVSVAIHLSNPLGEPVNFAGGGFSIANGFGHGASTCSGALAPGASCTFVYTFTPGAQGLLQNSTSLLIGLSSGFGAFQFFPVSVSGTGVLDPGLVTASPPDFDFGLVRLGRRAPTRLLHTNVTSTPVSIAGGGLPASSDGMAFRSINEGGAGCVSGSIAPGATCTTLFDFTPREARLHAESTSFLYHQGTAQEVGPVLLEATGVGPLAQVYPVEADLGEVDLGTTAPVTVTVVNDGEFDLINFVGGSATSPFSSTTTCTGTLPPGAQCSYTLTFNSHGFSLGPQQMQTAISFGNALGVQRTQLVTLRARGTALQFRDGFE